ncbi:ABC transporter substrate-binding protein [Staphylococcus equorum]|uniref:ABC transporter substrate-binding protein n=1 Tax=Staphylococcus equorum TaxID=246432 RepID=UPI001F5741B3|nr:ABC transporter substrate-binding protein [Staphylococcus equorum]UNP85280.1 ABC transporter substrate-binding protein [Staphylococcus equorum]
MKKIGFLLCIGLLFLAGCSAEGNNNKTKDGKVKIEYWHVNAETQGGKTVKELVKDFNAQSDDVYVQSKYNPDMYKGLIQNMMSEAAGGRTPDVVQIGWSFKNYYKDNFEYTSPEDVINESFPEDKKFIEEKFDDKMLSIAQDEKGEQLGLPYSVSSPVMFINKDILRKANLDESGPKTWEEVQTYAETIRNKSNQYGVFIQEPADSWAQQAIVDSNGGKIVKDGKASFASEEGVEAYQLMQDMVKNKSALHTNDEQGQQSFINGEVGMLFTTNAKQKHIKDNAKFDVEAIEMPSWEGKEKKVPAGGSMLGITSDTKEEQEASWKFMKYLYKVENMAKWTKGTGYVPPRNDVVDNPKGLKSYVAENEMMQPAIKQMSNVVPWAAFPGNSGLEAEQQLIDMRDKILGENADVNKTMKETQNRINQELD